ncbi:MAG: hypothetical protein J07AB43_00640 [Candidatus Nanosalina sp. J07AB43]|nr:MAG: hypothetical protein J07AB43_00640 [Candidatus Nanosalina sp. J07AB43]
MTESQFRSVEAIEQDVETPSITIEEDGDGAGGRGGQSAEPVVEGATELHNTLSELARESDVSDFKCAHPQCGLVHEHTTNKHRASDDFNMSVDEAASMEANPNCHCGLHETAERGVIGAPSRESANNQAPIPPAMDSHIDSQF